MPTMKDLTVISGKIILKILYIYIFNANNPVLIKNIFISSFVPDRRFSFSKRDENSYVFTKRYDCKISRIQCCDT